MALSANQEKALSDYLSRNPKLCSQCDKSDWEFGDRQLPAAEVYVEPQKIEPSKWFVELRCRSCGHLEAVDCIEAGIPDE